jgi:DNA-binding ferritin-like protein (Dps family)
MNEALRDAFYERVSILSKTLHDLSEEHKRLHKKYSDLYDLSQRYLENLEICDEKDFEILEQIRKFIEESYYDRKNY